jgi:hypothetical protein
MIEMLKCTAAANVGVSAGWRNSIRMGIFTRIVGRKPTAFLFTPGVNGRTLARQQPIHSEALIFRQAIALGGKLSYLS